MTQDMPSVEVILAAYNQVEYMRLVLEGYARQKYKNFSIAIADDGSGPEVAALIDEYRDKGLNIRHEWQEDEGFRKAQIVNRTIRTSAADYLILSDNDCIPQPDFVGSHVTVAEDGFFVVGRRINLRENISRALVDGTLPLAITNNRLWLLGKSLKRELNYAEFGLRLPWVFARLWSRRDVAMFGANFAVWRKDMLGINGFDSDFVGYGMADTDVEWRLMGNGVRRKALLGRGCVIHLYHKTRESTERNREVMKARKEAGIVRVKNGIVSAGE